MVWRAIGLVSGRTIRLVSRQAIGLVLSLVIVATVGSCRARSRLSDPDPPADPDSSAVRVIYRDEYADSSLGGVKDFSLIKRNGAYHIFHIADPKVTWLRGGERQFVHATSPDLLEWTRHPRLELRSDAWSRSHLWAPHVIEESGTYYLFYTGVEWGPEANPLRPQPEYNRQRIGLAISSDLDQWSLVNGNGLILDGPDHRDHSWCAYGTGLPWADDCRDPFVFRAGADYLMFVAVRLYDGGSAGTMAIATARSRDLREWTWDDPDLSITEGRLAESPAVIEHPPYYYLFWTGDARLVKVARSTRADGDYQLVATEGLDFGYANEVLEEQGRFIIGAIGRGDARLADYLLEFKELFFQDEASPHLFARGFTRNNLPPARSAR